MKKLSDEKARDIRLNTPQLLNAAEAAAYLCISPRKLWDETSRCSIRCARAGGRLIYQKVELDRWISALAAQSRVPNAA